MSLPALALALAAIVAGTGFVVLAAERGEPVRLRAREISLIVRESCAIVLLGLLTPLGWLPAPAPREGEGPRRVPVILVSGHRNNRSSLFFLELFLRARGYAWVHRVDLPRRELGLAGCAEKLERDLAEIRAAAGAPRVDLVGFSIGGLAAAWLCRHRDATGVRRLVTIGTPWRGTRLAVFMRGAVAEEMLYGAPKLDGLAGGSVPTVAVWSPEDLAVVPSDSAAPEGADCVRIDGLGHRELLLSSRVYRAVQAALEQPLPGGAA